MISKAQIEELQRIAHRIRCDIIWALAHAQSGHPGGSLSATDFTVALYFHTLKHDYTNCCWPDRDRVVFSKGHVSPLIFSLLAESGYIEREELRTFRKFGSRLQGHPNLECPGIEVGTGSLGQGLSVAVGMAIGLRMDGKDSRVYCIMGDGENQEGSTWEAIMSAGHFQLDNLCVVLDNNGLQIDGWVENVMGLQPLAEKWRAFRWHVIEIDGHDMTQCVQAFEEAKQVKGQPTVILAKTVKGKGVSFMENQAEWHGKAPKPDQARQALEELACPAEYFDF
ncbi:MAG: transketolase [Chloroflexi bacterium]|nr:transketolase [Chloroflexota bacterium]